MNGYDEQTWVNGESQANAQRFNHMEAGIKNAYNVSLIAITNIEPSECNEGDKYFNTSDNLIYTATDTDTWSETGTTPISDKTYVLVTDNTTYAYLNGTLEQIGGSNVEVVDSLDSDSTINAPSVRATKQMGIYSTDETIVGTWGGKPLYRRIYSTGALPDNGTKVIAQLDTTWRLRRFECCVYNETNGFTLTLPAPSTVSSETMAIYVDGSGNLTIRTGTTRSGYSGDCIVEYTKTTD